MRKLLTTILTINAFLSFAQAPQGINYQGVARDASGPINTQAITVKFDLHQGSAVGAVVFSEIHNTTTNNFGLFNLVIGSINTSTFSVINWASSPYFIETTLNGTPLGTQQLMSVPYALYANEAKNINTYSLVTSGNTATLIQNGTTNTGTISLTSTPNTTIVSTNSNLIVNNSSTNSFALTVPNYSITNGANTNTIVLSNGVNSSTIVIPTSAQINQTITAYSGNITVANPSTHVFGIDAPTYSITGTNTNTIVLSNGVHSSTVIVPASSNYTTGAGIAITSGSIINTAPNQTVTLTGTGVTGTYPSYTISASPTTTVVQGNSNITVTQSGNTYSVSGVTPTLNVTGATLSGSYPNQTLTVPTSSTTVLTASTNITISGTAPNYTISSPSQSLSLIANTLNLTNSPSVTLPTYSLASNSNSITIYQNGTAINTSTISLPATTAISQSTNNNILVSGSAPNYTLSTNTYSLSFPTYSTSSLTNGVNTRTATIPSPPISYNNGTLTVGNNSTPIPALWQENSGVISLNDNTKSVSIGTTTSTGGKFQILHSSSATSPHINLVSPTTSDFGKLKFATSPTTYFSTEAWQSSGGPNAAYSISHYNGTNEKQVFLINGLRQIYINALNYPLSSFHVMTSVATATGGITSEGFNLPGEINITRNNQASTARTDVAQDNIIGSLNFSGYGGGYGDGAHIYAKASENLTSGKKGTDLIFKTTENNTSNSVDRMIITDNGNVGIGTLAPTERLDIMGRIKIVDGLQGSGKVLTSDANGVASWVMPTPTATTTMPWTQGVGTVTLITNTDNVGIGTGIPNSKLHIQNISSVDGLYIQDFSNANSLNVVKQNSYIGITARFQNLGATNTSPVVDISNSGIGKAINAITTSSLNPTIFAKNSDNTVVAGEFDGGLKAYNSGSVSSIYAYKSSGNGNVAVFTNSVATNNLATLYVNTNSTSSLVAVAEFLNGGNGSAINATNNSNNIATINVKNASTVSSAVAGFFDGGIISKGTATGTYPFQVQNSAGSPDYLNVRNDGNVGIGLPSGVYKLTVLGNSSNPLAWFRNDGAGPAIQAISGSASKNALELVDGHLSSSGGLPTIAAVGSPSISLSAQNLSAESNDVSGEISFFISTPYVIPSTFNNVVTITFSKQYSKAPIVILTPANLPAATDSYFVSSSLSDFTIKFTGNGGLGGRIFNYMVIEAK